MNFLIGLGIFVVAFTVFIMLLVKFVLRPKWNREFRKENWELIEATENKRLKEPERLMLLSKYYDRIASEAERSIFSPTERFRYYSREELRTSAENNRADSEHYRERASTLKELEN